MRLRWLKWRWPVAVPLLSVTTRPSRTLQTLRRVFVFSSSNGGWESSGPVLQPCIDTAPLLLLTFTHEGKSLDFFYYTPPIIFDLSWTLFGNFAKKNVHKTSKPEWKTSRLWWLSIGRGCCSCCADGRQWPTLPQDKWRRLRIKWGGLRSKEAWG